jgi:hypothetical protein
MFNYLVIFYERLSSTALMLMMKSFKLLNC